MTERASYHHGDLAAALRDAATEAVRRDGAHRLSLRAVAREVGVDVAATYRHYRDKTDLLTAVARGGFHRMAARMREEADAAGPGERLAGVGRGYVRFALEEPELFRLMFGPMHGLRGAVELTPGNPYELLLDGLRERAEAGRCGVPLDVAADVAWSAVHGLAALAVDGPLDPALAARRVEPLVAAVLRGLEGDPSCDPRVTPSEGAQP